MTCKKEFIQLMHHYLDGDLNKEEEQQLRTHLQSCKECQNHFQELKRTITLLESNSHLQPSPNFTNKVINSLPKEKKRISYLRWFKAHPAITAAAIFFILMFTSVFSAWNQDGHLSVSKEQNLIIENDTVIVPEGVVVEGDLVVKNGNLKIEGAVNGDVVIINGEHLMASAGEVTGELEQVNQIFEWFWYSLKDITKDIFAFTSK
ncbi:zf-HC2 domain-containing protein [Aquibacillus albus]|uniref:Anti-sigma-W factor RsiW n=1 Tax=Aquibacillus albus TaxID=1168171 RepID=A0ABS2N566_9BACI|nr:zf-HC2 domain-containing protein [Aquibacillus albus]MBM7573290.1 anti-sigma factor RsiW [Aquibacillus albus]